ncbi:MAG: thioesterase [Ruminococcus sp.]|nr:thioesterase [Ruminococcus sp.]
MILFFLSHAGGSAKSYSSFKRFLPKDLTVVPLELSGRFTRSSEAMLTDIPSCAADLLQKHSELIRDGEYALFGHSMGTLMASELVRQAKEQGLGSPAHVFLSGRCAPDEPVKCFPGSDKASDEAIIEFFSANSLSGSAHIADEELARTLNRILCIDVRMANSFSMAASELDFGCDITVLYGTEDIMLKNTDINGWSRFTSGRCETVPMSGGHFYYQQHKEEVCRIICRKLGLE